MRDFFDNFREKVNTFFKALIPAIKEFYNAYKKNIFIPLFKILGVMIACIIIVKLLNGRETLADYARKHPETAYPTTSTSIDQ